MANKSKAAEAATETNEGVVTGDAGNDPAQLVGTEGAMTLQEPSGATDHAMTAQPVDLEAMQADTRSIEEMRAAAEQELRAIVRDEVDKQPFGNLPEFIDEKVAVAVEKAVTDLVLKLPELIGKVIDTRAVTTADIAATATAIVAESDGEAEAKRKAAEKRERNIAREAAKRQDVADDLFLSLDDAPVVSLEALSGDGLVALWLSDGQRLHADLCFDASGSDFASDGGPLRATYSRDILLPGDVSEFRLTEVVAVCRHGVARAPLGQDLPFGVGRAAKLAAGSLIFRVGAPVAVAAEPVEGE